MFWIHDIGNKKLTPLYRTMETGLYELCALFCHTSKEQSLAIHQPVKVLHNGRGPQKIKQERDFAKEKGDFIHTSSCDWRRSEGL